MNDRMFEIRCDAGANGQLYAKSHAVSVSLSQLINGNNKQEFCQSVLIICEENQDGSASTKVIVCHPEWDQNLQIACIRSSMPDATGPVSALEIDLKHVQV